MPLLNPLALLLAYLGHALIFSYSCFPIHLYLALILWIILPVFPVSLYGPTATLWPCPVPLGPSCFVLSQPTLYLPFLGTWECWSIYFIFFFSICFYAFFDVLCLSSFPHSSYFLLWEWFWFIFSAGVPIPLVGYTLQLSPPLFSQTYFWELFFFSQD